MLKWCCFMFGLFMVLDLSEAESKFRCTHAVFPPNKERDCVLKEEEITFWTSYVRYYRYDDPSLGCIMVRWRRTVPCRTMPVLPKYYHYMEECEEECRGIAK